MNSAGTAIAFVATAVASGCGVLVFSFGLRIHQWLANLIATAMISSALAAIYIIPVVILRCRPKFIFKPVSTSPRKSSPEATF